jgi:bifunctional oligoribonuclease and PAP phosphatase NrnA
MNSSLDAVLPLLRKHERFVLTTHVNPDGDGLGSEVALALSLRLSGKTADILNHSPTPAVYDFLDPERAIRPYDPSRDAPLLAKADVIIIMDTNHPDRLRSMQKDVLASPAVKICIDHHLEPAPFADHYIIDDDATSTGEIVYHLLNSFLGDRLPPAVAEALYTAIMTDTGSFRYPRVDAETHEIIAHLLRCGADPVKIYSLVYERWTNGRIHLLGEMLAHIKLASGGKIAHVAVSRRMLEKTLTVEEDTDNFTSYLMSIEGVSAGILFLELPRGVKISFRSRGDIPINELAKEFGGNGHKNAAGARLEDATLAEIEHTVIHAAAKYV